MEELDTTGRLSLERRLSRRTFLGAAGAAVALAACGGGAPAAGGGKKKYRIAIVPKGLDNPVFALAKLGLQQRAQELGDVDPIFTAGATTDTASDVRVLEDLVTQKVDAIGVSCNDPNAYVDVINKAVDAGIKVMCWDSDAPNSKRAVFYGVDSMAVGAKMGQAMSRLINGQGKIVIISGDAAALNLNQRIQGAKSALGPGIQVVNTLYTKDDIPTAISATEDAIRSIPDLKGILMVGGWALFSDEGATPLLDQKKGQIKVVSFDPLKATVQYLKDDIVQSVWTQDYWGWGYQSATILYGLLHGQTWNKFIPQPSMEVTPSEWQVWQQRWAAVDEGLAAAAKVWGEKPFTPPGPSA
jgi:ribose transport system substrate-binding protein